MRAQRAVEVFFGLLNREWVNRRMDRTRAVAGADVFDCSERFHNRRRRRRSGAVTREDVLLPRLSVETGYNPFSPVWRTPEWG